LSYTSTTPWIARSSMERRRFLANPVRTRR